MHPGQQAQLAQHAQHAQHAPAPVKVEPVKREPDSSPPPSPEPSPLGTKRPRPTFGDTPFSSSEERMIRQRLDVGLSRSETMQRPGPGGVRLTYIEGWKVIHEANQTFGFNGWSSAIVALDLRFVDEARGRFCACVSATVRVTLRDGCSREDRGGGLSENMRSKGEAILKAEKEAITDATKRTLKNFGLRLGLSLYDRAHVREMDNIASAKVGPPRREVAQSPAFPRTHGPPHSPPVQRAVLGASPVARTTTTTPRSAGATTPVTPAGTAAAVAVAAAATTATDAALVAQVAANREKALQRQAMRRANLPAAATVVSARPPSGDTTAAGAPGPARVHMQQGQLPQQGAAADGTSRPVSSDKEGTGLDSGLQQREIDELSAIALADF